MTKENSLICNLNNTILPENSFGYRVHKIIYSEYLEDKNKRTKQLNEAISDLLYSDGKYMGAIKKMEVREYYKGLIQEFEDHFREWLKKNNWETKSYHFWIERWDRTCINLSLNDFSYVAELMYKSLYKILREYELKYGWIYKGIIFYRLGELKLNKDLSRARTYFLLSLVEDIIWEWKRGRNKGNFKNEIAYKTLNIKFHKSKEYLDNFREVLKEYVRLNNLKKESQICAEEIIVWYYSKKKNKERQSNCFDFDLFHAEVLCDKLLKASDNKSKGKYLEQFLAYIFFSQTNFEVRCNEVMDRGEIDLRLRNSKRKDPFLYELGSYILVEAKNTKEPITTKETNHFVAKVRASGCRAGIVFSLRGVTKGHKKGKSANSLLSLQVAYHRDNVIIMPFDIIDLKRIVKGENFNDILLEKYEDVRFNF